MKFIPLRYKIGMFSVLAGLEKAKAVEVAGLAFEFDGHRLCARRDEFGMWVVDDYDTGLRIGAEEESRELAIDLAIARLRRKGPERTAQARADALARLARAGVLP